MSTDRLINPFPAAAVARYSHTGEDESVLIETAAIRQLRTTLDEYLNVDELPSSHGVVVAVVGEYGTGKTFLAMDLLARIRRANDRRLQAMYLDAPSDSFLGLYRDRFIPRLRKADVLARVQEYLADILAEELEGNELVNLHTSALRERRTNPDVLIRNAALSESQLTDILRQRLAAVTESEDFSTALLLLRRRDLEDAVWEWFNGHEPDQTLVERGVTRHINNDTAALESMGVMMFLFGRQRYRLVLVIDEIEKILSHYNTASSAAPVVLAFKKLMESAAKACAMLVLCGLPDFLEALPQDAQNRIGVILRPSPLTAIDAERYIRNVIFKQIGAGSIEPFSTSIIQYIVELSGGNARKIIRLFYHGWQRANNTGTELTAAMLRTIAREQFEMTTVEDVTSEVVRCLDARGWKYERDHELLVKSGRVDFWIPVANAGIAICLTRSLLQKSDLQPTTSTIQAIKVGKRKASIIVVVNGHAIPEVQKELQSMTDKLVVFRERNFREDLDAVLEGVRLKLESDEHEDQLAIIREKLDGVTRQTLSLQSDLHNLREHLNFDIAEELEKAIRSIFGRSRSKSKGTLHIGIKELDRIFDKAESILKPFEFTVDWDQVFDEKRPTDLVNLSMEHNIHSRELLREHDEILELIRQFRRRISLRTKRKEGFSRVSVIQLCQAYDRTIEELLRNSTIKGRIPSTELEFLERLGPEVYSHVR